CEPDNEFVQKCLMNIELTEHEITINNGYKSEASKGIDLGFVSVNAKIIQETEASERIISLLNEQKANIDKLLNSQLVYALGPDFQHGYSVPCIACWVDKPLDIASKEQLSALFDDQFEIISHVVEKQNEEPDDNDKNRSNRVFDSNNEKANESNRRNDEDIQSIAKAKYEEKRQSFIITTKISVNISKKAHVSRELLEFNVDFIACGVGKMLNEVCGSLPGFVGYYLDSISIEVQPIPDPGNAMNIIFDKEREYNPRNYNQEIETTENQESSFGGQINLSVPSKVGIQANIGKKTNNSTKITTSKWIMKIFEDPTDGVQWLYDYNEIKPEDYREWPTPKSHTGYWFTTEKLKGFRIVVMQTLCCRFEYGFNARKKPEIIKKCPKIFHKLEISFNNLTNFNRDFEELAKKIHSEHENIIFNFNENNISSIS
ncbi:4079_t:CDS:2, partial [Gigaspora rosea]